MVENVVKLATNVVNKDRHAEACEVLDKFAEDEQLEAVFVVGLRGNGEWIWDSAGVAYWSDLIGRIEVAKHDLTRRYLESICDAVDR